MKRHYAQEYYVYLGKVRTWCNVLVKDNGEYLTHFPGPDTCKHCQKAYDKAKEYAVSHPG